MNTAEMYEADLAHAESRAIKNGFKIEDVIQWRAQEINIAKRAGFDSPLHVRRAALVYGIIPRCK